MAGVEGVISLAQGIVHWAPPADAIAQAAARAIDGRLDQYGPANGLPELVYALKHKLKEENGLEQVSGSDAPNVHEAGSDESSDLLLAQQEQRLCPPAYLNASSASLPLRMPLRMPQGLRMWPTCLLLPCMSLVKAAEYLLQPATRMLSVTA